MITAAAQQPGSEIESLRKEVEVLRAGQNQIQKDLQLIKSMILGKQISPDAPPLHDTTIGIAGAASLGSPISKVVLIEFSDFQCPFCGRYANSTFGELVRQYASTGKLQYVFRNFPLREAHPFAGKAAEAAECAGSQGKFWEAHESLFRNQQLLDSNPLGKQAHDLGLDESKFRDCLDGSKMATKVRADEAEAARVGVNATPTFFFGYRDSEDPMKVHALKMLTGAQPEIAFAQILEYLLDPPPGDGGNK